MAGSEKTGFDHSNERILENAYYILTPGGEVGLEYISEFYRADRFSWCYPYGAYS